MAKTRTIGGRLRAAREAKGWTHEQLARESGLSLDTVIKIQSGRRQPGGETLVKLCRALGVSSDELLGI